MGETTRTFLAILLPRELREAAGNVQAQMREIFPPGAVRWVAEENFHLTLRFFGDLDRKALGKASAVVEGFDGHVPAMAAHLGTASAFPSPSRPQTLWVAVQDKGGELDRFAAEVDLRIREAGFGPSDKPWKSHLTLGRVGRDARLRLPSDWSAGVTAGSRVGVKGGSTAGLPAQHEEFTIHTIALMQSELRPQGPRYTPLRTASAPPGNAAGAPPRPA